MPQLRRQHAAPDLTRRPTLVAAVVAAAATCCAAAVAWAQESDEPIDVGYRHQVFVVKGDGGARRLTRGPEEHFAPAWSPDGTRIAMRAAPATNNIEVRDFAGKVQHEIRGGTVSTGHPAWSYDGRRLAFVAHHRDGKRIVGNLVVTSTDGSDRTIVATRAAGRPAWSADGRTLYYLHGDGLGFTQSVQSLWSVPSDGGTPRQMASYAYSSSQLLLSPSGRWVLFEGRGGLRIIRASDGGGARRVVDDSSVRSYGWVPGSDAVYGGKRKNHLLVTSLDGSRRPLGVHFRSSLYAWSPDGKRIAWVDNQVNASPIRVMTARPNGTGRRVVARFTSQERLTEAEGLEWSRRGNRFAIVPFRHVGD